MIPMSDLLNFSKTIIDDYEKEGIDKLTMVQRYYYDCLKSTRHYAVRYYIRNNDYYDEDLLRICQQLALEKIFLYFSVMSMIAKCRMDQDFQAVNMETYLN